MAVGNTVRIIITGDAKDALRAFGEVDVAAGGMGTKLASVGKIAAVAGVATAAAFVGVGVALFSIGEMFDEAYDKIRVGTGSTGEELQGLKDDLKGIMTDVPATASQAADALTAVFQKLGNQTNTKEISEQFLELSRITGTDLTGNLTAGTDALNNWGVSVEDQGGKLDLLFRTSQQSGQSFGDLAAQMADAGTVFRAVGLDFDSAAALLGTLGKAGVDVSSVIPALSKSLATAAKDGKDAKTVFSETFAAIKNAPDSVTAAGTALDVFGAKAGPKLAEMIRAGTLDYQSFLTTIQGGTDTILGAGKETQDFGEKWQLIKNRIFVALEPLAMKVFDGVGKAMDKLGPIITKVGVWFDENLPKAIAAVKPWVDKLVAAFVIFGGILVNQVFPGIQKVFGFLQEHDELLKGLAIVVGGVLVVAFVAWAWAAGAAAVATIAAALPVIALIAGLALLVAGIIWVVENFDIFKDAAGAAFDWVQDKASAVVDWLANNWQTVIAILGGPFGIVAKLIYDHWDAIIDFITGLPGRIASAASGMWDGIYDAFRGAVNAIVGAWNDLRIPGFSLDITMPSEIPDIHFGWGGMDLPNIPYLAKGGIVMKPTLAMIGEAGPEAIVPLGRGMGGGNTYINVSVAPTADKAGVGLAIMEALTAAERKHGTRWRQ